MGGHWLIALLALPGACQEPPGYQQKLERARHRIAQLERVVPPQVLRGVAGAWVWRVAQFLWSAEACATSLRHAAVAGAALAASSSAKNC